MELNSNKLKWKCFHFFLSPFFVSRNVGKSNKKYNIEERWDFYSTISRFYYHNGHEKRNTNSRDWMEERFKRVSKRDNLRFHGVKNLWKIQTHKSLNRWKSGSLICFIDFEVLFTKLKFIFSLRHFTEKAKKIENFRFFTFSDRIFIIFSLYFLFTKLFFTSSS